MIHILNRQRKYQLDTKKLEKVIHAMLKEAGYSDFDLSILFTSEASIRKYNRDFRGKDVSTDILSFPYHTELRAGQKIKVKDEDDKQLGDIIISPVSVEKKAELFDRSFEEHLIALLAHGIAHLLGYDHETDAEFKNMDEVEKKLLLVVDFI